jgi:hypothetical protein
MAKQLLELNVHDSVPFKEPWRRERLELEINAVRGVNQDHYRRFDDMEAVTTHVLQEGQKAVEIFGWGIPIFPAFIRSKLGAEGHVYSIDSDPEPELSLFLSFVNMYDSFRKMQAELEPESHNYFNAGTPLMHIGNEEFLSHLGKTIETVGIEWVKSLTPSRNNKVVREQLEECAREFYEAMGIDQITQVLPPYPDQLGESSIDAVFEHMGFSHCYEHQKEGIITGADRILRPGGHLAFCDIPREIVTTKYYGQEMFNERYSHVSTTGLNYPHNWLVLRKEG